MSDDELDYDDSGKYDSAIMDLESILKDTFTRKDEKIQAYIAGALFAIANELAEKNNINKKTEDYELTIPPKIRKRNHIPKAIRHEIFKRDDWKCKECGKSKKEISLEIDHIIPVSKGGTNEMDNLQTLCKECNQSKIDRILDKLEVDEDKDTFLSGD